MAGIQLGQSAAYVDRYDVTLLEAIPRALARSEVNINATAMQGWDIWTAFELSWMSPTGMPKVAVATFSFSASSENIVESKSFKYYLNSFNQTSFSSERDVVAVLVRDLTACVEGEVKVELTEPDGGSLVLSKVPGQCLDALDCTLTQYEPSANILCLAEKPNAVSQRQLYSHLFKSNCPVTAQPDWATVWLQYSGKEICEKSMLAYLVSYRRHQGFHESCVERIYSDVMAQCQPEELTVYARYTRRGGLDINPYRTSEASLVDVLPFGRLLRQ